MIYPIWPQVKTALYERYQIRDWIDILADGLDLNPERLYQRLLPYANAVFEPAQRIVIYHRDTDYYYHPTAPGFTMHNLYTIFQYLNVPSEYVILLCAFPDMQQECDALAASFNVAPVRVVYCPYQYYPTPDQVRHIDINHGTIQKPFVCLNRLPRIHRLYTLSLLKEHDMFHKGMVSLAISPATVCVGSDPIQSLDKAIEFPANLSLCQCRNATRINETLILDPQQRNLLNKWFGSFVPYSHELIESYPADSGEIYQQQPSFLQYALWNLVLETVGEYPHTYLTEKTTKAILTKRPFAVLGGKSPMKNLRRLGFKTFDRWIDESYDDLATFADRSSHCVTQIKSFCDLTPKQLQQIAIDMQETLEHNFQHYISGFGKKSLEALVESLV